MCKIKKDRLSSQVQQNQRKNLLDRNILNKGYW